MKKSIKTAFALILSLCALCALLVGCGGSDTKATYKVTVTCSESYILNGVEVVLLDENGAKAGRSSLTDGAASFELEKGTYRVTLSEKLAGVLEGYTFEEQTLTEDKTAVTVALTAKDDESSEPVSYTVKVTDPDGNPVEGVIVQLCSSSDGAACYNVKEPTDKDGIGVLTLPAGEYEVHVISGIPEGFKFDNAKYTTTVEDGGSYTLVLETA